MKVNFPIDNINPIHKGYFSRLSNYRKSLYNHSEVGKGLTNYASQTGSRLSKFILACIAAFTLNTSQAKANDTKQLDSDWLTDVLIAVGIVGSGFGIKAIRDTVVRNGEESAKVYTEPLVKSNVFGTHVQLQMSQNPVKISIDDTFSCKNVSSRKDINDKFAAMKRIDPAEILKKCKDEPDFINQMHKFGEFLATTPYLKDFKEGYLNPLYVQKYSTVIKNEYYNKIKTIDESIARKLNDVYFDMYTLALETAFDSNESCEVPPPEEIDCYDDVFLNY